MSEVEKWWLLFKNSNESYKNLSFFHMASVEAFNEIITNLIFSRFNELSSSQKHRFFSQLDLTMESRHSYIICNSYFFFSILFVFHISVFDSFWFETKLRNALFVVRRGRSVHKMFNLIIEFGDPKLI